MRELTVSSKFRRNSRNKNTITPKIILAGVWMQEAGFKIGDKVSIIVKNEQLIITKT